jgi:hypothetical protein
MHLALLVALAVTATFEPENLKGVTSMRVIVENIPGADKVGLDADIVQTDIEALLRKAGIKVTQIAGILPYVHLQTNVLPLPDGCVAYSVHVALKTGANTVSTKRLIMGDLWSDGVLGARCKTAKVEVVQAIRRSISDEANKMVNDILVSNQN